MRETRGRGHLMGVTLGVLQNQEFWMGEGDDMIFVDDEIEARHHRHRIGRLLLRRLGFRRTRRGHSLSRICTTARHSSSRPSGPAAATACTAGMPTIPVTFTRYMKHTMEHGHANHRADNFYSVCYWYQTTPYTDFPALPAVADRIPVLKAVPGPGGAKG